MSTDAEKIASGHYMEGKWISKDDKTDLSIEISQRTVSIAGVVDGEPLNVEFDNSTWWVEEYLLFKPENRFYLHYANEKHMGFGELILPGDLGQAKWGYKFDRVD